MGSKICMNSSCGTATTHEWKKGWPLRSAGYADLCYSCGSSYENLVFCDTFHLEETGWRDCYICHKRLHCGCIASKFLFELLDYGGVACTMCAKSSRLPLVRRTLIHGDGLPNGFGALTIKNAGSCSIESRVVGDNVDGRRLVKMEANEHLPPQSQRGDANTSFRQERREEVNHPTGDEGASFSNPLQPCMGPPKFAKTSELDIRHIHDSLSQPPLSMTLGAPSGNSNIALPFCSVIADGREQSKTPFPFQLGQRSRPILPKPSKNGPGISTETNKSAVSQMRIARPPVEGRGKNHFLPRYWPRITDQELQQLSGEYPCLLLIFSRIDPGGKLVMGFRKATNPDTQDAQTSPLHNGVPSGETSNSNAIKNSSTVSGYTGLIQTPKGRKDPHINSPSGNLSLADRSISWGRSESQGNRLNENSMLQPILNVEKKRTRNIGSKSKRLLMHSEDALELRLTWEEAQDLLRPPLSVKPSIITIEDHEFEEYDELPIFGKRTLFIAWQSGGQEQWAQCDDCSKWRRLPVDVLLPSKWHVQIMFGIQAAPEEISPKGLENLLRAGRDLKKRRPLECHKIVEEHKPSGLDALASAAVLGEKIGESGESSMGATTKHPRHRPGSTCIVCIQPPSGKGKHNLTCSCNVCLTVKRRFKTLMLRKKKRRSEREAEMFEKEKNANREMNGTRQNVGRHEVDVVESSTGQLDLNCHPTSREDMQGEEAEASIMTVGEAGTKKMALENCEEQKKPPNSMKEQPDREDDRHFADEEFVS